MTFHTDNHGVIRQWVRITNRQPGAVTLHEVAAATPLLAAVSPHLTHFGGGGWSAEWTTTVEALTPDPNRIYEVDLAASPGPTRTDMERQHGAVEEGLVWPLSEPCTARIWVLRSVSQ